TESSRVGLLITSREASWWTNWMLLNGILLSHKRRRRPVGRRSLQRRRSAIRQGDVQLENRAAALILECDLYLILVDIDVLADDLHQLFLQGRQVVWLRALAAFMGDDDLQSLLGDGSRRFLLLAFAEEIQQVHSRPPNRRARKPCFLTSRKRWPTSLPSSRSTASL